MSRIVFTSLALLITGYSTFAQPAESTRPQLTNDLLRRIDPGAGSPRESVTKGAEALTEADVLKLLPTAYRLTPTPADSENDWVIICGETTEFVIEFTEGKVSSRSATFHPAAESKTLTLERFRELKEGMTKGEVEKLFGEELSRVRKSAERTQPIDTWRYVRGRELEVYISKGHVTGALLKAYKDN